VLGAGAVGLAALMAARVVGADPIIAVDITDERLELARELGASHVINGKREDTKARILDITRRGADYIVDLTGHPKMLAMAVEALAPTGSVALIGAAPQGTQASIDMAALLNRRVPRSHPGRCGSAAVDSQAHRVLSSGQVPVRSLGEAVRVRRYRARVRRFEAGKNDQASVADQ